MRKQLQRIVAAIVLAFMAAAWIPAPAHAEENHAASAQAQRYPVIFVPGIAGSELYNDKELVWINAGRLLGSQLPILSLFSMNWLLPLRLAADGVSPYLPAYHIHTGDIMRKNLTDAYSGMLEMLKAEGYVEGRDLRLLPYDWRLDPALAADQLGRLVDMTLAETGARQVILVAHSLGGLVARDYVVRGGASKVKASISLATPWLGAPLAYRALEYGWDLGLKLPGTRWAAMSPKDVKLLVQNYPSVYALAPESGYFDWYPRGYLVRSGRALSFGETVEQALAPHNGTLAHREQGYLQHLLDGSNHGVLQFVLAGRGRPTVSQFTEKKGLLGLTQKVEGTSDGDEVVPLYSADLGYSKDPARAQRYIGKVEAVAYDSQSHTLFAQSRSVQDQVRSWLRTVNSPAPATVR
jgi:pimeloyl-ACP methyl ester carboxylesterase